MVAYWKENLAILVLNRCSMICRFSPPFNFKRKQKFQQNLKKEKNKNFFFTNSFVFFGLEKAPKTFHFPCPNLNHLFNLINRFLFIFILVFSSSFYSSKSHKTIVGGGGNGSWFQFEKIKNQTHKHTETYIHNSERNGNDAKIDVLKIKLRVIL